MCWRAGRALPGCPEAGALAAVLRLRDWLARAHPGLPRATARDVAHSVLALLAGPKVEGGEP